MRNSLWMLPCWGTGQGLAGSACCGLFYRDCAGRCCVLQAAVDVPCRNAGAVGESRGADAAACPVDLHGAAGRDRGLEHERSGLEGLPASRAR